MIAIVAIALVFTAGPAKAASPIQESWSLPEHGTPYLWYEDFEDSVGAWDTWDGTANHQAWFHADTLGSDPSSPPSSWWCGSYGEPGWVSSIGYGNCWRQYLELPAVSVSGVTNPTLSFRYKYDLESSSDFAFAEAKVGSDWQEVARFTGDSGGWMNSAQYDVSSYASGGSVTLRFRVETDPFYSDEDGQYDSDGGFFVDEIVVFNPATDETLFYDHAESLCTASAPVASGDYWHLVSRGCQAYSDPHSFWCGDDADTTTVPANLYNFLISPVIELVDDPFDSLCIIGHVEMPYDPMWMHFEADYFFLEVRFEGITDWFPPDEILWANDFGRCDGWFEYCIDISSIQYGLDLRFRIGVRTSEDGVHDTLAGGAGLFIDDCYVVYHPDAAYGASWGVIKTLFK